MRLMTISFALALAACSKGKSGGDEAPAPVGPPTAQCQAAARNIASFQLGNYATEEERAPVVQKLAGECAAARISAADATCLAEAPDKDAAARCKKVFTAELIQLKKTVVEATGTAPRGGCRSLKMAIKEMAKEELKAVPEEHRADAMKIFPIVERELVKSCQTDGWPNEITACIDQKLAAAPTGYRDALGCIEELPPEIQRRVQERIRDTMQKMARGEDLPADAEYDGDESTVATGVPACDAYQQARRAFEKCPLVPGGTKRVVLGALAPFENPWRKLPSGALPSIADQITPMCEAATEQLTQIASATGCAR